MGTNRRSNNTMKLTLVSFALAAIEVNFPCKANGCCPKGATAPNVCKSCKVAPHNTLDQCVNGVKYYQGAPAVMRRAMLKEDFEADALDAELFDEHVPLE